MLVLAIILAIVALAMLFLGLRGLRVNAAAHCRKCRFELAPTVDADRPGRCPECGRETGRVRTGRRKKNRPALVVGMTLLLVGLGLGGYVGASRWGGVNTLKPTWVLRAEIASTDAGVQTAAIDELLARLAAGEVGSRGALRLADRSLDVQGDWDRAWNPKVGALIDEVHGRFGLPDEMRERYGRNGIRLQARAKDAVRPGSLLPVLVQPTELRLGPNAGFGYMVSLRNAESIRPADALPLPESVAHSIGRPFVRFGYQAAGSSGRPGIAVPEDAESGSVSVEVQILALPEMIGQGTRTAWGGDEWLAEASERAIAAWTDVIETNPVRIVSTPNVAIAIEPEVFGDDAPEIRLNMHGSAKWTNLNASVITRNPSVPMAFRLIVELPDGRSATSSPVLISSAPGTGSHGVPLRFDPPLSQADQGIESARVRITPAPEALEQLVETALTYFGGPKDYGDLPIRFTDTTGGATIVEIVDPKKPEPE